MDPEAQEQEPNNLRLWHLLQTHLKQLEPELLLPEHNAVLIEQGDVADSLLLVQQGRLSIEIHQNGNASRTIAEVGAGAVLGEMALFGIGETRHGARVRVLEANTEILRFSREALHSAVLFDAELAAEMLLLSSERCRNSNRMINLLLDGIDASSRGDATSLASICSTLRQGPDSMEQAAGQLEHLLTVAASPRPES
ncbi:cyclic nucleotide-binding domain-containing protein [Synechococcus sp. MU1625]|uniref:cyclic nucleotide-binding domain-containing protein n=1 Tax=Synechococcus sp. MU1625 TaxID=2508347 RepID=UPI001CF844C9|nr:cyclic nucleotide-binding domain-containing protein [Synechococcus sp. MU1625]